MSSTTRSFAVAVVHSTGTPVGQQIEHAGDAAVVGPEVVTPVADAVRLVDHEQPDARRDQREHVVAEAAVGEPLGRDEQEVDLVALDRLDDPTPLVGVVARDAARAHAAELARVDLVAHQRQQRRHEQRRARALRSRSSFVATK